MKKLQPTTQYKKDYKKYRNNPKKVEALKEVLKMLMNEQPIPAEYKPYMLLGELVTHRSAIRHHKLHRHTGDEKQSSCYLDIPILHFQLL